MTRSRGGQLALPGPALQLEPSQDCSGVACSLGTVSFATRTKVLSWPKALGGQGQACPPQVAPTFPLGGPVNLPRPHPHWQSFRGEPAGDTELLKQSPTLKLSLIVNVQGLQRPWGAVRTSSQGQGDAVSLSTEPWEKVSEGLSR